MCGRFTIFSEPQELSEYFQAELPEEGLVKRYNAAPGQDLPILTNDDPQHIRLFRWGLIPSWAKNKSISSRMINARAETILQKKSYSNAFARRRCLVLADGFYEWKKNGRGKTPMYFTLKSQKPFAFAGIWEKWRNEQQKVIYSFSIITTKPNKLLAPIHNRMPVILPQEAEKVWLDDSQNIDIWQQLLVPYVDTEMEAFTVSQRVGSVKNDDASLIQPQNKEEQATFFDE